MLRSDAALFAAFSRKRREDDPLARTPSTPAQHLVVLVGALMIFLQAYRFPVNVISPGIDRSFPHVLNLYAFTSMRFGTDLVYTYGPLGFLSHIENVRHDLAWGFVFWTVLYASFSVAIASFVVRMTSGVARWSAMILAVGMAGFVDAERVIPFLVLVLLLVSFEDRARKPTVLALCGVLTSIALLMKFPTGVACVGIAIGSLVWPLDPRRTAKHFSIFALSAVASLLVLWIMTSGSLDGIGAYVVNSLELTSGYSAVMSSARLHAEGSLRAFLAALGLLIVLALLLPTSRSVRTLLVVLFPLFVSWKSGVVRFDGHIIALVDTVVVVGFLLVVLHFSPEAVGAGRTARSARFSITPRRIVAIVLFVAACAAVNHGLVRMALAPGDYPLLSRAYTEDQGGVKDRWMPGLVPLDDALHFRDYQTTLNTLGAANSAPATLRKDTVDLIGRASVDIYASDLGLLAANPELNYRPKPVFQHFNAFTERLDRVNASFFASPERPDVVIMQQSADGKMDGVDGRHPLFDDPVAFLEIMNAYRPIYVEEDVRAPRIALLRHVEVGAIDRFAAPRAVEEQVVRWNEVIDLPATDGASVLRAKIGMKASVFSRLKEAVFRLSPMYLTYLLADGTEQRYRLVPPHLSSGVWISPLFEDYAGLFAFLGGKPAYGPQVTAIRFEADDPKDYPASFKLTWEQIDCRGDGCRQADSRVFSSSVRRPGAAPILITSPLLTRLVSPVATIAAIDVRLSTYARVNEGTLTLQLLDAKGAVLRASTVDPASIVNNQYNRFVFEPVHDLKDVPVDLRLTYEPARNGTLAAWRTSSTATDFDFEVYGH